MATNKKSGLTRQDLAKFLPDQRSIKAFENLFIDVNDNQDTNIELIDIVALSADGAASNAILALSLIEAINQLAELKAIEPNNVQPEENRIDVNRVLSNIIDYIEFDVANTYDFPIARLAWSANDDTLSIGHTGGVIQQIGEETFARVTNNTGALITNGTVIGLTGSGTSIGKYIANGTMPPIYCLGIATQDIANTQRGRITVYGRVRGINTTAYVVGDVVYADPTTAGAFTKIKPTAPNISIPLGVVTLVAVDGEIFVRPVLEQQKYFGSFALTTSATLPATNTATAITLNTTNVSNGVSLGSPASRIVVANSGLYSFVVSFQLAASSSSIKDVYLWFRKNGTNIANSAMVHSLESGTAKTVQSRNYTISMNAGDYIELYWASPDNGVQLSAIASTAFSPAAPAVTLNVNQIQQ
jgi:hypothetical protein